MRLLAIADERDPALTPARLRDIKPDLVVSCGDLEPDYLDYVSSAANATLVHVPGNHDQPVAPPRRSQTPALMGYDDSWHSNEGDPEIPGFSADGQIVELKGITFAGLGGSIRYRPGPNQYTEKQMARRAQRLRRRARVGRKNIDIFLAHSPPQGMGDESDGPHQGFACFIPLLEALQPTLMLHGHIHPHGFEKPDRNLGSTRIVNVIPHKVMEL